MDRNHWPALPYSAWRETCINLQLRSQIVGKIRLARTPWLNHSWHVPLYLTARGLTTGPIPHDERVFQVDFDFIEHRLVVQSSDGRTESHALVEQPIADFYQAVMTLLRKCDLEVRINVVPNEVRDPIPFDVDRQHFAYDAPAVERFWRALLQVDRVFRQFRSGYLGKVSPVHFFWGSFDLAVTRFSGRPSSVLHSDAPPGLPLSVAREAYSHEVSSAGFWPGGGGVEDAAFYSYAYPQPAGFAQATVEPREAWFDKGLGEFLLPYEVVRNAPSPDETLLAFLQSTYRAAADRGAWDRDALECAMGVPGVPRSV
ncbi:MAG: hypothetical protein K0R70_260 [Steroidobacteraceae bacterium]|jgi:hypothetical protein|nr:hypothetical protein [Steroidobacteraceae bacterium]